MNKKMYFSALCIIALSAATGLCGISRKVEDVSSLIYGNPDLPVDKYNVVWTTHSGDSSGSMPIGNGDIGLNLWIEKSGDLLFYISKTDSWSENARLLKLGMVRIKLKPALDVTPKSFRWTLELRKGRIVIKAGQEAKRKELIVWVDANRPVIHVEAEGAEPFRMEARLEIWRSKQRELSPGEANSARGLTRSDQNVYPIIVYPDTIVPGQSDRVVWYHRNEKSCYEVTLNNQHLGELLGKYPDPLMHRTFGGAIKGDGLSAVDDKTLASSRPSSRFVVSIHPLTAQTESSDAWLEMLNKQIEEIEKTPLKPARIQHEDWWEKFWNRSWIYVSGGSLAQEVTTNTLPLRIGADSSGQNRFKGHIARTRVFERALKDREIAFLAKNPDFEITDSLVGDWKFETAPHDGVFANKADSELPAKIVGQVGIVEHEGRKCAKFDGKGYIEVAHNTKLDLANGFTVAAWIAPEKLGGGGGRIIDKSLAGTSNGYLLDTNPGNSLRLIVESMTLTRDAKIEPGKWVHVAAVYEAHGGQGKLYINDVVAASETTTSEASFVSRGYVLQRWVNACGGRGAYPIKFNGSIFTVDAQVGSEHYDGDFRRWGGMFWWQNTRLPYWSMLASGDFDLIQPLFAMYKRSLGLCRDKTRLYYGHEGAFFPETMYFWGTNGNCDFGWGHKGPETVNRYIRREWQGGIELTAMMLDYYDITQDKKFLREMLLPHADETITFYDRHWKRGENGRIHFEPAQALETWWVCANPLPEVAGLRYVIGRLLEVAKSTAAESQMAAWRKTLDDLPEVPLKQEDGKSFLLPAEKFSEHRNSENPELYAIFPYRLYGLGAGGMETGLETWRRRSVKGSVGWRQDAIQAAYLGLGQQAGKYVSGNFSTWHSGSRFPVFWGPNFDWVPDQDHGSVAMTALQRMLLQCEGRKILVLPAWPAEWDVDFKLHAPMNTTVEGVYRRGELQRLKVTPERRRSDVQLFEPQ